MKKKPKFEKQRRLNNAEKQARHRKYRNLAIRFYEAWTGVCIKDMMDMLKLQDLNR